MTLIFSNSNISNKSIFIAALIGKISDYKQFIPSHSHSLPDSKMKVFDGVFYHSLDPQYPQVSKGIDEKFQNYYSVHILGQLQRLIAIQIPGPVAQSIASLIADPGVTSLIPAQSHTCVEIDYEIFSTVILLLPLIQEGLLSVTSESMCMKYW